MINSTVGAVTFIAICAQPIHCGAFKGCLKIPDYEFGVHFSELSVYAGFPKSAAVTPKME